MHDPMTVAFEIRNPFWRKPKDGGWHYHPRIITVWHVDPERRGDDDSCDWFGRRRRLNDRERALEITLDSLFHRLGTAPYYPSDDLWGEFEAEGDELPLRHGRAAQAQRAMYEWRRQGRFRWHPRWHVHHWSIQVHAVERFKRWAFSRCEKCGGRFTGRDAIISGSWHGTGPRWFRGERNIWHMACDPTAKVEAARP